MLDEEKQYITAGIVWQVKHRLPFGRLVAFTKWMHHIYEIFQTDDVDDDDYDDNAAPSERCKLNWNIKYESHFYSVRWWSCDVCHYALCGFVLYTRMYCTHTGFWLKTSKNDLIFVFGRRFRKMFVCRCLGALLHAFVIVHTVYCYTTKKEQENKNCRMFSFAQHNPIIEISFFFGEVSIKMVFFSFPLLMWITHFILC